MTDQAHGLRQMFGGERFRVLPLVHNALVSGAGAVMERLCATVAERGLHTLVVDAAPSASPPHELATIDLAACVEPLTAQVSYLAARGLPALYLDSRATMAGFLDALRAAAPHADVVVLHVDALDLRRIFSGRAPRPIVLAGARPDSLTGAYASMKLIGQRLGALTYDLIIADDCAAARARGMAQRLAECADHLLGSALRHCATIDPYAMHSAHTATPPPALRRLVGGQLDRGRDELPANAVRLHTPAAAAAGWARAAQPRAAARLN